MIPRTKKSKIINAPTAIDNPIASPIRFPCSFSPYIVRSTSVVEWLIIALMFVRFISTVSF